MRHVLIAVCGRTPQIVTETAWALTQQREVPLSEIRVITTQEGSRQIMEHLMKPETGHFWRFCRDYHIKPGSISFSEGTVHVLKDARGKKDLEDIRTSEENELARNQIFKIVQNLTRDPEVCLHGSIAGGRKSMGFLLGSAVHFFGRAHDRLYHVLVAPPEIEQPNTLFHYPPPERRPINMLDRETHQEEPLKVKREGVSRQIFTDEVTVELADIPFCRLSEVVRFVAPGRYDDETLELTQQAIDRYAESMRREYARRIDQRSEDAFPEITGDSPGIRRVKDTIRLLAPHNIPVLVCGPTGSGKELVAKALHRASKRTGELVPENCAAIPPTLAESTLFGHEKGAFSGAVSSHRGLFEQAHEGTLFLDEIDSLPLEIQSKLLRVLEEGRVRRVGGSKEILVDVRLITATNKDLTTEVRKGRFREDLFHRIHGDTLEVPSLRERAEDIPLLAEYFRSLLEAGKRLKGFAPQALHALNAYDWPGNVRELKKVVERAVVRSPEGTFIREEDLVLPLKQGSPMSTKGLREVSKNQEIKMIRQTLQEHENNITRAAEALEMPRTTLSKKIKKYGLKG